MTGTSLFLDTNVFLHYRPIREIDWKSLVAAEHLELVVDRVNVQELDKHKDQHRLKTIRERAFRALKEIEVMIGDGCEGVVSEGVTLRYEPRSPLCDFAELGLDPNRGDDCLLASILTRMRRDPTLTCVLVHHDIGLKLLARYRGISSVEIPAKYKLQDALDEQDRQVRSLQQQVLELQTATPKLSLFGEGAGQRIELHIEPAHSELSQSETEAQVQVVRERNPLMAPTKYEAYGMFSEAPGLRGISKASREAYNEALSSYYKEVERMIVMRRRVLNELRLFRRIGLVVDNAGSVPAENLDLYAWFPKGISIVLEDSVPSIPPEPIPPRRPEPTLFGMTTLGMRSEPIWDLSKFRPSTIGTDPNVSDSWLEVEGQGSCLRMHIHELKHGHQEQVSPAAYVQFDPDSLPESFQINYRMTARNMPTAVNGTLPVIVQRGMAIN